MNVTEAVGVKIKDNEVIAMTVDGYIIENGVRYGYGEFVTGRIPFSINYVPVNDKRIPKK